MKKTWILAGAVLVVAASAMEAGAHGKGGGRQGSMGMGRGEGMGMVKGARVGLSIQLGLSAEQQTQLDALKATYEEKEIALRDEEQAAFKALLTAEQQTAIDAATASRVRHRGPAITLTADQQTQLAALRTEYRDKHEALHAEFQTAFEALLTADQKAELAELHATGPFGTCVGAGPAPGTSSIGSSTQSSSSVSSAKAVAADGDPAAEGQSISWGQLKSAGSE